MKNRIVNYFVIPQSRSPKVYRSPVTMNAMTARDLLRRQFPNLDCSRVPFHVCFDVDSGFVYLPDSGQFSKDQEKALLDAAKIRIIEDFGEYAGRPAIHGSPFSSIRVRALDSFRNVHEALEGQDSLPIIEANLERMPSTVESLPLTYQKNKGFMGGLISDKSCKSVTFKDELTNSGSKRPTPITLLTQKTPFICVNISRQANPSTAEKEWVVLSGYRDYLLSQGEELGDLAEFADLYAIKHQLYFGWPIEQMSRLLFSKVKTCREMIEKIHRIMSVVESLKEDGHKDFLAHPYYMTFKIGNDTPIPITTIMDSAGCIDLERQVDGFKIIDYDSGTNFVIIRCEVFIPQDVFEKVLKAKSGAFIYQYNPVVDMIDCKSQKSVNDMTQLQKIIQYIQRDLGKPKLTIREGAMARGEWAINAEISNVRKVSDYPYACESIKEMCKFYGMAFDDLDVIVGPIERFMGRGSQGGFVDLEGFKKANIPVPYKLDEGLYLTPPAILINAVTMPSYADQVEVLIHEYRHYIYSVTEWKDEKKYGRMDSPNESERLKQWNLYLNDKNERQAHMAEIRVGLSMGRSVDEIIRNKVGGAITMSNYPIAIKFKELVDEVVKEVK